MKDFFLNQDYRIQNAFVLYTHRSKDFHQAQRHYKGQRSLPFQTSINLTSNEFMSALGQRWIATSVHEPASLAFFGQCVRGRLEND
uniref:Uncharacterized protein n=1 Tax=Panagrellus redivivus TaxID=6233 RepID=A0A7E4UXK7_PANRE